MVFSGFSSQESVHGRSQEFESRAALKQKIQLIARWSRVAVK